MNTGFLEQFYENVILPRYKEVVNLNGIKWKDHGQVESDGWAHYFEDKNGREYVLLCEDSPDGSYLGDNLSHEMVAIDGKACLNLSFEDHQEIPNITGYFTLYREK